MQKTTVYGLPLNPQHLLQQLAGSSFCVSYATRKKLGKQLDQAIALVGSVESSILLVDNGAFSAWQNGVNTMNDEAYLEGFARWANRITKRCRKAIIVLPDVIDGSADDNCALAWKTWQMLDAHDRAMPVWHMHETLDYLIHLCEHFAYVAIGSSAQYKDVGSDAWRGRMDEVFEILSLWEQHTGKTRPRLHMMRGTAELHNYPFDSADSVNVAMNHNRWAKTHGRDNHVARMAAGIDAKVQTSAGPIAPHQEANKLEDLESYNDADCADFFTDRGFEVGVIAPNGESIKRSSVTALEWTRLLAWCDRNELADLQNDREDGIDFIGPVFVDCDDDVKDALRKYSNDDLSDIFDAAARKAA